MNAQTQELLRWLERTTRSYAETVETWRTSCPRLSIWEDALAEGLVEVVPDGTRTIVVVTARGRSELAAA